MRPNSNLYHLGCLRYTKRYTCRYKSALRGSSLAPSSRQTFDHSFVVEIVRSLGTGNSREARQRAVEFPGFRGHLTNSV